MKMTGQKSVLAVILLSLANGLWFLPIASAGSLEPSGAPGPTMKTLSEIEPRTAIHKAELPLTITSSGSYYMVEDANCVGTAITINADNVTIDLMGYTLNGPDLGPNQGINISSGSNIEIKNGTVRDFGQNGIYAGSINCKDIRTLNLRVISNGGSGIYLEGAEGLVKDCLVAKNGQSGIHTAKGYKISGCTVRQNTGNAIEAGHGNTVSGNVAYYNQSNGITTGNAAVVIHNSVMDNSGTGIVADTGCTISSNSCHANGNCGISAGNGNTITGNTCYSNDSGITTGGASTVTGNTTYDNAVYGIKTNSFCLIDHNTCYSNGTNLFTGSDCQTGLNVAP